MKGIILSIKINKTKNSHGGFSYNVDSKFKEVSDNFNLKDFISKLKKASNKDDIVQLLYFDTENNVFEKYNNYLVKQSSDKKYIIEEVREILDKDDIELFPVNKKKIEKTIDENLKKELGDYYKEDNFYFEYDSNNKLKSVDIYLSEGLINWEHSTDSDAYQQYGQEAWEDDDFMEPNFDDYQELKEKLLKALKDIDFIKKWNLDYSEKNTLHLSIMFK
jgi:hypothetical protein